MTGVAALWAIVGKRPGDSTDYRVLACSANEVAWFDALEHPDRPGTPEIREAGQVASLPWVTFGYGSDPEPSRPCRSWNGRTSRT